MQAVVLCCAVRDERTNEWRVQQVGRGSSGNTRPDVTIGLGEAFPVTTGRKWTCWTSHKFELGFETQDFHAVEA